MFGFFKKKNPQPKPEVAETPLSPEAITALQSELQQLQDKLPTIDPADPAALARHLELIGLKQAELGTTDEAIKSLEQSLEAKRSIGDGYKKLMSLYNQKRAESARNGDDQGIDYYMGKMDEMRQIAKQVTISGE